MIDVVVANFVKERTRPFGGFTRDGLEDALEVPPWLA